MAKVKTEQTLLTATDVGKLLKDGKVTVRGTKATIILAKQVRGKKVSKVYHLPLGPMVALLEVEGDEKPAPKRRKAAPEAEKKAKPKRKKKEAAEEKPKRKKKKEAAEEKPKRKKKKVKEAPKKTRKKRKKRAAAETKPKAPKKTEAAPEKNSSDNPWGEDEFEF